MEYTPHHITDEDQGNQYRFKWLTTFNDMITLLMVFFVLLFAMSTPDAKHFENLQNGLQSAMGVLYPRKHSQVGVISDGKKMSSPPATASHGVEEGADSLNQLENTQGLEAEYTKKGIQLTLNDNLLFKSGAARLTPEGNALLDRIARIIGPLGRYIRVEGHTDNVPISTRRYPSNWELSTARAVNVVKYLQRRGGLPPHHLSAAGYGASKPRVTNESDPNRSRNRRVDIILQEQAPSNSVTGPMEE